jgi:hypothetical protein
MAKSTRARTAKGTGPPDPRDFRAFRDWLKKQPREWSVIIAARAALRVLPLMRASRSADAIMLPMFRAVAIAQFAAKYPKYPSRAIAAAAAAAAAATSVAAADAPDAYAAADVAAASASAAAAASASEAAGFAGYAASTAIAAANDATVVAAIENDALRLYGRTLTANRLAREPLWSALSSPRIAWQGLARQLRRQARHWQVWIDWYDDVVVGAPHAVTSEAEDAAFTDIPGKLPWSDGADAVNTEIARRLQALRESGAFEPAIPVPGLDSETKKTRTIARLAELASPQPSITDKGQLDAGPNQPFDVPTADDDLSTLPIRQRNLIKGILNNLPANAPKYLKDFLGFYDDELKVRGVQPILGLLKDDADIITAAVAAPSAADEWLEPGMRKAFDRFAENHIVFVEHFPLDPEREAMYAQTSLDEDRATGKKFVEPFETVAKATEEAHKAGATTDDFLAVIDKVTELVRFLSTQPPARLPSTADSASVEIRVSPQDRIQPVSTKKRAILGALGFFERTYNLLGSSVTIATASSIGLAEALKPAIEALVRLLH